MTKHNHNFVERYNGFVGYGLDKLTDQATLTIYFQKISDDKCILQILERMNQEEMDQLFNILSKLLRKYLNKQEYHTLFLKNDTYQSLP